MNRESKAEPKRREDGSLDIEHYLQLGRYKRATALFRWWMKTVKRLRLNQQVNRRSIASSPS
ncbi:MAG: hypothetical protein AB2799_08990, partial [Candidatus Thiodiazotropha sp.]